MREEVGVSFNILNTSLCMTNNIIVTEWWCVNVVDFKWEVDQLT